MRALALSMVMLAVGCSSPPPATCDANTCTGCCLANGQCVSGLVMDACGANGAACDVCVAGQTCSAGKCGGSAGGGAGGGGGVGGGGSGSGGGTGGGGATGNTGTFPDISGGSNGRMPMLMIDATGTRHLLYEQLIGAPGSGSMVPVRYGECTTGCATAAGWKFATIGDKGEWGGLAKLALTAQGKPRAMWSRSPMMDDPDTFYFGTCDSNCTNAASWTTGPIKVFGQGEYAYSKVGRNLAVDGTGRVHFVYSVNALFYISCAANCTQAASWSAPVQLSPSTGRASLAVTSTGQVKVAYTPLLSDEKLGFRSCDGNCDQAASWTAHTPIWPSLEGQVSLRLDGQGRPRIFFNENGSGGRHLSFYTYCDSNCATPASWSTLSIGLTGTDGKGGLDFDLAADGSVAAAFETEKAELGILRCPSNCQSLTGQWSRDVREDSDSVKKEVAPPLPARCSTLNPPKQPYSYWYPGEETSAAINPTTGKLEVAHRTYTLESCGFSGNQTEGVTIPRYSGPF